MSEEPLRHARETTREPSYSPVLAARLQRPQRSISPPAPTLPDRPWVRYSYD